MINFPTCSAQWRPRPHTTAAAPRPAAAPPPPPPIAAPPTPTQMRDAREYIGHQGPEEARAATSELAASWHAAVQAPRSGLGLQRLQQMAPTLTLEAVIQQKSARKPLRLTPNTATTASSEGEQL